MQFIKFMEINLSKKKKWILRIICICALLQLPIVYFMDKFYYLMTIIFVIQSELIIKMGLLSIRVRVKKKDLFIMLIVLNML